MSGLSDEVSKWKKAYEEEFELTSKAESEEDFANLRVKLKRLVYKHAFDAIGRINTLSISAESENTQFQANRWLAQAAMADVLAKGESDDPMSELVKKLTAVKSEESAD